MAKLTVKSKDQTLNKKMTIKQLSYVIQNNQFKIQHSKYKKILIASFILNIGLILTTIMRFI